MVDTSLARKTRNGVYRAHGLREISHINVVIPIQKYNKSYTADFFVVRLKNLYNSLTNNNATYKKNVRQSLRCSPVNLIVCIERHDPWKSCKICGQGLDHSAYRPDA